jgi:TatD DNase family protein
MTTFEEELRSTVHPLIDGHTHVDQFGTVDFALLLERARLANVGMIVAAGTTVSSCERVVHLATTIPIIVAGIGLHPADLEGPLDDHTAEHLYTLASSQRVVEWSECGLDYLQTSPKQTVQQDAFRIQIRLAKRLSLPLVTHSREADEDTLRILKEEHAEDVGGAWHYFGGSIDLAERIMDIGFNISLAKPLLRDEPLQKVATKLPIGKIVIETDSYPQQFKKNPLRRTEPWHLPQVAGKLAELQGIDIEIVAEITTANYLRMLKGSIDAATLPLPIN